MRRLGRAALLGGLPILSCGKAPPARLPVQEVPIGLTPGRELTDAELLAMAGATGGASLREAPIGYVPGLVRAPVVRGSVRGKATWMLVDTGATHQFLADWMIQRIMIDAEGGSVTDHAGRSLSTGRLDHPELTLDAWGPLPDEPAFVLSNAGLPPDADVGVTLSPQRLGLTEAVVLDFPRGRMSLVPYGDLSSLATRGVPLAPSGMRPCGGVFLVASTIGGHAVNLLLDTGASSSDLRARSTAGRALASRSEDRMGHAFGAGGAIDSRVVHDVRIEAGEYQAKTDVYLVDAVTESTACGADGVLGMDVLEHCVLAVSRATATGWCQR